MGQDKRVKDKNYLNFKNQFNGRCCTTETCLHAKKNRPATIICDHALCKFLAL